MKLIAAADKNWAIGKDGELLVRISEDMKNFSAMTTGNVIVMGSVSGFIHAGAHGNKNAYVVAGNLNPKVLQIAGNIAEAPDDENYEGNKQNIPEIAFVSNDIIVIESYLPKTIK